MYILSTTCLAMATPSALVGLLLLALAVGSSAATAPSSQCAYLEYYGTKALLPSLLPSVSSKCLTGLKARNKSTLCVEECRSLYSAYSQCTSSTSADLNLDICDRQFNTASCSTLTQQDLELTAAVQSTCNSATYCSPSCRSSIAALETFSGCCRADVLNGPKVLCGQSTIAPCPSILNGGSVAAPSNECAYILRYLGLGISPTFTPSLSSVCRSTLISGKFRDNICIAECQSIYALIERWIGKGYTNYLSAYFCGAFNNQNCSTLSSSDTPSLAGVVATACSNSTYCSPKCLAAIAALEQYGGCCYAYYLNGPKVLCGQQPIPYCSTIVSTNGGSTAIFNVFLMISMIAVNAAATCIY